MKLIRFTLLILVSLLVEISCQDTITAQGNLRISYVPHITQDIADSYYWYIYPADNYPNLPHLRKGYLNAEGSTYDTNTAMVTTEIRGLNPGNYVFSYYYRDQKQVTHTIQVTSGKTNAVTLKNN
jgi:hypothetical protein